MKLKWIGLGLLCASATFADIMNYDLLAQHAGHEAAYANVPVTEGVAVELSNTETYGGGGFNRQNEDSKNATYTFFDAANGITFGFDITIAGVGNQVDAWGNGVGPKGEFASGTEIRITTDNITFSSAGYQLNSASVRLDRVRVVGGTDYDISIDTDGDTGNGYEVVETNLDGPLHSFTATDGIFVHVPATSSKTNDYRIDRLGWDITLDVTAIPEPATMGLVAIFGGGILWIRRRVRLH